MHLRADDFDVAKEIVPQMSIKIYTQKKQNCPVDTGPNVPCLPIESFAGQMYTKIQLNDGGKLT